jgi:hypothetical protein
MRTCTGCEVDSFDEYAVTLQVNNFCTTENHRPTLKTTYRRLGTTKGLKRTSVFPEAQ